jgi:hypothetical protein
MSNEGFKVQASIKDNDGDMVNFRADSIEELVAEFSGFPYAEYAQAKASLRGAAALGGIVQPGAQVVQQAPPANNGWGQPQAQQQSAPPQQQSQGGGSYGAQTHPEGLACNCGKVLEFGKTRTNKGQWKCPDYRWNNGNPNEHRLEWAN